MSAPIPSTTVESFSGAQRPILVLFSAMMGVVLVSLDVSVVNVALEALRQSFDVQLDGLQWILNIYTLTYAVCLLSAGALSDRIGARATFVIGFAFFTLSSVACGLAPSFAVLLAARVLQGVGAALLVPSAMALLQQTYPDPRQRARAVGLWAGAGSLALVGGPVLGGALIAHAGWRSIFLINLPLGVVGACISLRYAPRSERLPKRGVDLAGQIVAAVALICVTGALTQAGTLGWSHPLTLGGLIMGCALFTAFLGIEARCDHPMMPLDLFGSAAFSTALFVGAIINFVYYGLVFVFSLFFQLVQGKDALATGLSFVPLTALIMFVNVAAGNLIARFGLRPVMLTGLTMATVGYLAMLSIRADSSYAAIAPTFIAAGVGIALVVPSIMTAALSGTGPSRAGIGAGVLNSARQIGGAVGVALFGSIIAALGPNGFVVGMHISIAAAGIALIAALLIAFTFIPSEEDRP
jgi:DHA2 family methylenomycin A resistance protein-like MFS transporter